MLAGVPGSGHPQGGHRWAGAVGEGGVALAGAAAAAVSRLPARIWSAELSQEHATCKPQQVKLNILNEDLKSDCSTTYLVFGMMAEHSRREKAAATQLLAGGAAICENIEIIDMCMDRIWSLNGIHTITAD